MPRPVIPFYNVGMTTLFISDLHLDPSRPAITDLFLAFLLAILLVYVVMASQFQSLLDPFIIMFTVPLGIVGVKAFVVLVAGHCSARAPRCAAARGRLPTHGSSIVAMNR